MLSAAVALLVAPPGVASAASCKGGADKYDYNIRAAGHNGGVATRNGAFEFSSRVEFSYDYRAILRACRSLNGIRINRSKPERSQATHQAEQLLERREDGSELSCIWSERMNPEGPLRVEGYGPARGASRKRWSFSAEAGIFFSSDDLYTRAYADVLEGAYGQACETSGSPPATEGPLAVQIGLLEVFGPHFIFPSVHIGGAGAGEGPPVLRKLLDGKNAKLDGQLDYRDYPNNVGVENGSWRVLLEFRRRRG